MDMGKRIAELRSTNGMSQQELSDRLYVSRDLVAKWECGRRRPDYPMIEKIAEVFGVSSDTILPKENMVFAELAECLCEDFVLSPDELVNLLNRFLQGCSAKNADMFMMRYYFLDSTKTIADAFGMSENHIRSRLSKIRKKFRHFIKEELS